MNDSWGYHLGDRDFKSTAQIIRLLVSAAGRNANLLLNVGPMPDGRDPAGVPGAAPRGRRSGCSGTARASTARAAGPVPPRPWGVTTQSGDRVFVHVLDWPDADLSLPPLPRRVRAATLLAAGSAVPFRETPSGITLTLPARAAGEVDQIVVLELAAGR